LVPAAGRFMFAAVRSEGARRIAQVQTAQHYFEILELPRSLELPRIVWEQVYFSTSYESKYATAAGSKGTTATGNLPKLPHALATEPTNDPVHPTAAPTNGPSGACHGAGTELNLTTRPDPCSRLELCPRSPTLRTVTPPGNAPGWHIRTASKSNRGCCNVADTSTIAARTNTVRA